MVCRECSAFIVTLCGRRKPTSISQLFPLDLIRILYLGCTRATRCFSTWSLGSNPVLLVRFGIRKGFLLLLLFSSANHDSAIDPYSYITVPKACGSPDKTHCHILGLYDEDSIRLTRHLAGPGAWKFWVKNPVFETERATESGTQHTCTQYPCCLRLWSH